MPSEHLIPSAAATSSEHTVAWVFGQPVTDLPQDLFIPPDALKVVLSSFQGPLDLLLYLIRKQNIDVLDIPMVKITEQYLHYIAQMEAYQFDLAAEYLLMAAMLIEIKSRLLLPRPEEFGCVAARGKGFCLGVSAVGNRGRGEAAGGVCRRFDSGVVGHFVAGETYAQP